MTDDRERKAAAAKFKKSERATEGAKAMADYKAEGEAERAKTVRLKAQRLAKEATDKKEVSDPPPHDEEQTVVKRPKWPSDSLATKDDKQKKGATANRSTAETSGRPEDRRQQGNAGQPRRQNGSIAGRSHGQSQGKSGAR